MQAQPTVVLFSFLRTPGPSGQPRSNAKLPSSFVFFIITFEILRLRQRLQQLKPRKGSSSEWSVDRMKSLWLTMWEQYPTVQCSTEPHTDFSEPRTEITGEVPLKSVGAFQAELMVQLLTWSLMCRNRNQSLLLESSRWFELCRLSHPTTPSINPLSWMHSN